MCGKRLILTIPLGEVKVRKKFAPKVRVARSKKLYNRQQEKRKGDGLGVVAFLFTIAARGAFCLAGFFPALAAAAIPPRAPWTKRGKPEQPPCGL